MYKLNIQDVGLWLEEINLGGYRQVFEENGVNGEYLESLSTFTTEQILRFIRRCHMKWGDFITLCKELRRIKGLIFSLISYTSQPLREYCMRKVIFSTCLKFLAIILYMHTFELGVLYFEKILLEISSWTNKVPYNRERKHGVFWVFVGTISFDNCRWYLLLHFHFHLSL